MTPITRFATAALLATGFAALNPAGASAQDWLGPYVVGTGENSSVAYPAPSRNIVGGATYRVTGSGENEDVEVLDVQHANPGRLNHTTGSGESLQVVPGAGPSGRAG